MHVPRNTVLTLCGDVEAEDAFERVERQFGSLSSRPRPGHPIPVALAPLTEPVRLTRRADVPHDRLTIAFRLPADRTPGFLPAALALDILGGLATSRAVRRLVRGSQQALSVHSTAWGLVGGVSIGFLAIDVANGEDPDRVEAAVLSEVEDLAHAGPTSEEMQAVRAQSERGWLQALAHQDQRADLISHHTLLHDDPHAVNTHLEEVLAVTPEQIQAATTTLLRPEQRAVVAYLRAPHGAEEES